MTTHIPKIIGADTELGNFVQGATSNYTTGHRAARLLLKEIPGIAGHNGCSTAYYHSSRKQVNRGSREGYGSWSNWGYDSQDWGRKYLPTNGGCFYIDLGHLEACTPELMSARDFLAAHHANLLLAQEACTMANQKLRKGESAVLMANNSDGHGNSWGGHISVLLSRRAFTDLFDRLYPALFYLAAFQVSGIVYTGQGKVGAENGRPSVSFQLTQRGDFFECLVGEQTTHHRPIVNARDESLCGGEEGKEGRLSRLHVIFFDTTLGHVSTYLKVGTLQLIVAMIEARRINPALLLADPLEALRRWGHDADLGATAALADGRAVTAVELQLLFLEEARRFVDAGEAAGVPEAEFILSLWEDTLVKLERRDFYGLAPRLDWVMKKSLLERVMEQTQLSWKSPEVKQLDLMFACLDSGEGLYWALEREGAVEYLVTPEQIDRFRNEPPADTRAWSRATLLRKWGRDQVSRVNWDEIEFRRGGKRRGKGRRIIRLDDPAGFTRAEFGELLGGDFSLDDTLQTLGAKRATDTAPSPVAETATGTQALMPPESLA